LASKKFLFLVFWMLAKQKYDRGDIRQLNTINVLEVLRTSGPLSRANIASHLGLTRATVSNIVALLLANALISETELDEGGSGRPGMLLTLNPGSGCMLAVEIDLDCITLVLAKVGLEVIWKHREQVHAGDALTQTLARAELMVKQALVKAQSHSLRCFGICLAWAGLVNHEDGRLEYGPTSGWRSVPLRADWERQFGVPVYVENEAHAGAIAAYHFGPSARKRNFVYLSVGVGLAAGIFVDGILLRGKKGFAGQVGHTFYEANGKTCACGKQGCWVTEVGAKAVMHKLMAAGVPLPADTGSGDDWIDWIAGRAEAGEEGVIAVLAQVGRQLGYGAARIVETFNPSTVIVGGRLAKLMRHVESEVRSALLAKTLPYMGEGLELIIGNESVDPLMGGLATVLDSIMKNPLKVA
jgi:predicted NBD/HSP70 family sugar kinase